MLDGRWASETSLLTYLDVATAMGARSLRAAAAFRELLETPALTGSIFIF